MSEKRLNREDVERMEREIPSNDRLNQRLGVGRHYGSIEAAEEKRFPWIKARRLGAVRRRNTQ